MYVLTAGNGNPLTGAAGITMAKCATATNCTNPQPVATNGTTAADGTVFFTIPTPTTTNYYQIQYPGNSNYAPINSPPFTIG